MSDLPCIVFVTTAYGAGRTGPETYARYLWEEFGHDSRIEFHLVAPSFPETHSRWHASGLGGGSLGLYRQLAQAALKVAGQLSMSGKRVIVHINNSNLHSSLLSYQGILWGQVNDYENADAYRRAGETIHRAGWRRFFALVRRRWLERRFLARQDLTLCNSNFTREKILSEYKPPHPERVITVYKAVDLAYFRCPQTPPEDPLQRPAASRKYVFVGDDVIRKGLDTLLHAVIQFPASFSWHLTIVGATQAVVTAAFPHLPALDPGRITFTGRLNQEKLREILWHSDVFVLPSRAEALGVAVLEALAAGLPVVASNVGGIPEILRDPAAGILTPPDDPATLSEALRKVQPWPNGLIPTPAQKILDSFSTPVMLARLRELYLQSA